MQIKRLHKNVYSLYRYARTQECLEAYRAYHDPPVRRWEALKAEGVSDKTCQEVTGISRATYYRRKKVLERLDQGIAPPSKHPRRLNKPRWGEAEKQLVLRLRRENPTWGKDKIGIVLRRDHNQTMSNSTVGRILKVLSAKGLIQRSASAIRQKRKRCFRKGHAKPWDYKKYADMTLGERIQIDHMTVRKNGVTGKHFQAWDRRSKFIHAQVYSNATSASAKRFLLELLEKAPFKILSIQVDGGSEFMAEFEEACAELGIPLIVLPPAKPKYNGGVERGNRTFREEFWNRHDILADTITGFRTELAAALKKYNTYRPHKNLDGMTPMAYIKQNTHETLNLSHIT